MPNPALVTARRHVTIALGALVLALTSACASSGEFDTLRELAPAPLVVLVEVEASADDAVATRYGDHHATASTLELRTLLAQELRALNASTRVLTPIERGGEQPDVILTFLPQQLDFSHVGTASFLGAGGLWLVTWIGGLLVPDSTYSIRMDALCRYSLTEDDFIQKPITGGETDLSFFERNDLISLPSLQSLILPPFWTSDQTDKTTAALRRSAMRVAARQIAAWLKKNEFETANEQRCAVRLVQPAANDAPVTGAAMRIELAVAAKSPEPITLVTASVNGGPPIELARGRRLGLEVPVTGELTGLDPERPNLVRIAITADKTYTRTLRLVPRR